MLFNHFRWNSQNKLFSKVPIVILDRIAKISYFQKLPMYLFLNFEVNFQNWNHAVVKSVSLQIVHKKHEW